MRSGRKRHFLKCNIPLALVVIVIFYLYITASLFDGNLALAGVLATMTLWSLYAGSLGHPGPVRSWTVADDAEQCKHCGGQKPPRTHHCRRCDECIERFDHHCDWLDNCVGRRNYKAFVLFLVYILACIAHYFWQLGHALYMLSCTECRSGSGEARATNKHALSMPSQKTVILSVLTFIYTFIVIPSGVLALVFLVRSTYNAIRNRTTYDEHIAHDDLRLPNRGLRLNLEEALGPMSWKWCIPTLVDTPPWSSATAAI